MKYSGKSLLYQCALLMLAVALIPRDLYAQRNFVYTNDDQFQNTVSAFSVGSDGILTLVPGSPFATGGNSIDGGPFATNRVGTSIVGHFLFAANTLSADVSVFKIDSNTGALTLVPGAPFAIPTFLPAGHISIAPTPDGRFLIAAGLSSSFASIITVFSIGPNGALTPISGSPFSTMVNPFGIRISPDGKFLAVGGAEVQMFRIAPEGALTSLGLTNGSNQGFPVGVDIDCSGSLLYAGEATQSAIVDGYHIGSDGTLTPVAGSPFQPGVGIDSSVVVLSPDDKTLFVSNQLSTSVTAFRVAQDGSLSLVAGSPFFIQNPNSFITAGMATSQDGSFLYVTNDFPAAVAVFRVGSDGALTEVPGSPFLTGVPFGLLSLTAFPPKSCSLTVDTVDTVDIAIKPPAAAPLPIDPDANGKIPVAILSTPTFDAVAQVDPTSLTFGHSGSEASLAECSAQGEDVNNDGLSDLVCQFNTSQTGLVAGDNTAILKGKTVAGRSIQGSEAIRTVPQ
jgi:6-phosphogluconolactonase